MGGGDNTGGGAAAAKLIPRFSLVVPRPIVPIVPSVVVLWHGSHCTAQGIGSVQGAFCILIPEWSCCPLIITGMHTHNHAHHSVCCRWHQHQCEGRQHSTTLCLLFCLVLTCLWTRSLVLRVQQQDVKLYKRIKLDRIKWLQHRIRCNNIHIPVFPDNWHSINISIHLNILVSSLHP